jgi:hypothetical protein
MARTDDTGVTHAELTRLAVVKSASYTDNLASHCERPCRLSGARRARRSGYVVECATDDLAQTRADELLADTEYPAMEVWMARVSFARRRNIAGVLF